MSDWAELQLSDICNLISSKTSMTNASLGNYVSTENMMPNFGGLVKAEKLPSGTMVNAFLTEDVLFSNIRTYFKKVWSAQFEGTVSADVLVFRAKQICDPKFLYYTLCEPDFTEYTVLTSRGAKMPRGDKEAILSYKLGLPPLPEQKAIASVLSSLDDKIDLLHRQNKTLEAMAETLFRQWFIEEAKEDWEEADLTQLIELQSGYAFKSKDFQESGSFGVIKIKNISGNIIDIGQTDFVADEIGLATAQRFHVKSGQVLIAMTGAEIGKLGLIPKTTKQLLLNQRVGLLVPRFKGAEYLAYLHLKSEFGQDYIENSATGSAQPNISGSLIEACPFPSIDNELLRQCGMQVQIYYEKVKENLGQIQTLENLRDTLLPKLMSGEVRVQYQTEEVA
ncbi:restriction endonuclease subunit S [Acinetobacter towneri]|uniref:Restriction endonuclease subunit S n=1 Tax=Acinetobacter towneri TaxID=202956 RepID=A0AB35M3B4_9GAMM|nr:restriction endonuclease subunit S [Acinetobacter towneri]MDM1719913.1 restriction endonuclease subunit S [Acinetobacter towneri]MDM1731991.1 restriction endonuclease subunit S [Acinetobacter towneri]MDM1734646.1 restriction endonuclease subunit S [Acinetobacter towneri]MDM1739986.1 restriction endonuclease subunit S [Acinetobacter towneri]MDM1742638.1 restriction endonuclease subunit S [Acinetobacter towneri]